MKVQHGELTAYHMNHWWWQKQEYASSFHDLLVSLSQWMRKHLLQRSPSSIVVARKHAVAGRFSVPAAVARVWTRNRAVGVLHNDLQPPSTSTLRLSETHMSSTRTQPHCDRSLHSWFLVHIKLLGLFIHHFLPFSIRMCIERWKEAYFFFFNPSGCFPHVTWRKFSDKYI